MSAGCWPSSACATGSRQSSSPTKPGSFASDTHQPEQSHSLTEDQLAASFRVASGPLGDFCDSLHDLLAHVLMWDEINLAVLTEATAGRAHWSLDPRGETPEAGRVLERRGGGAAPHPPAPLPLHRFQTRPDSPPGE